MNENEIEDMLGRIFWRYLHTITIAGEGEPNIPHRQVIFKEDIPKIIKAIDFPELVKRFVELDKDKFAKWHFEKECCVKPDDKFYDLYQKSSKRFAGRVAERLHRFLKTR